MEFKFLEHKVVKVAFNPPPTLMLKILRNREAGKNESVPGNNRRVDGEHVTHPCLIKKGSDLAVVRATET